jgi:hypothetical protein
MSKEYDECLKGHIGAVADAALAEIGDRLEEEQE